MTEGWFIYKIYGKYANECCGYDHRMIVVARDAEEALQVAEGYFKKWDTPYPSLESFIPEPKAEPIGMPLETPQEPEIWYIVIDFEW